MRLRCKIILIPVFLLLITFYVLRITDVIADTIRTNGGRELKGIVVEEYADRVILSTADGEITVRKADIRELTFDNKEDNLIALAERAKAGGDYATAYAYYAMALKINPDMKAAKDGLAFITAYVFRAEAAAKEAEIDEKNRLERFGTVLPTPESVKVESEELAFRLKKSFGIVLVSRSGIPEIESVARDSAAYDAGARTGDSLVAVWNRLTGYMPLRDVMKMLLDKPALEVKCTIERTVSVPINPARGILSGTRELIGAKFRMEFDGLTVSSVTDGGRASHAGLARGDLITAIDGCSTRYMPLRKALRSIKYSKSDKVLLTLRRDLTIWRRD